MADRFLRLPEVLALIGVKKSTVYSWLNKKSKYFRPDFPSQKHLSPNGKGAAIWSAQEIEEWMGNLGNNSVGGR